jgi:hypothetical protein
MFSGRTDLCMKFSLPQLHKNIEGTMVVILLAGTRENFYEELKRMYKK